MTVTILALYHQAGDNIILSLYHVFNNHILHRAVETVIAQFPEVIKVYFESLPRIPTGTVTMLNSLL
jgi:hypothetical protein